MKIYIMLLALVSVAARADFVVYVADSGVVIAGPVKGVSVSGGSGYYEVLSSSGTKLAGTEDIARLGVVSVPAGSARAENISEIPGAVTTTFSDAQEYTETIINGLISQTESIAEEYGVGGSPIDWFLVDAAIEAATQSTNEIVAMRAIKDGIRLNKNALFLKEWGIDLFNVRSVED